MKRIPLIDSAPGKELFPEIAKGSFAALEKFYELRKHWAGGQPLVHDHYFTYGYIDDLMAGWETKLKLIPFMTKIALKEEPEFFHCALFLLMHLIPHYRILPRLEGFEEDLLLLEKKVEQFIPRRDISDTWNTLTTNAQYLKPSNEEPIV